MIISDYKKTAVAYYRHSAEDKQENSIALQREQVEFFAKQNSIQIIAECIDDGVSGVTANRAGFQELLLQWVEDGTRQFDYVLVLDVSRFGRFQNPDEAGAYTFRCYLQGKPVVYAKRGFPRPGEELMYSLADSVERVTSGNYSKELSDKVWRGQMKITEQGYSAGGSAPYGLRRVLLDEQKQYLQDLLPGQHKIIANQRVTFAPGVKYEQRIVQCIFNLYVARAYSVGEITNHLNNRRIRSPRGAKWNDTTIRAILRNPKYTGATVYNKVSQKLHTTQATHNNESEWSIKFGAFKGIVSLDVFQKAQEILKLSATQSEPVTFHSARINEQYEGVSGFYQKWVARMVTKRLHIHAYIDKLLIVWHTPAKTIRNYRWVSREDSLELYVQLLKTLLQPRMLLAIL